MQARGPVSLVLHQPGFAMSIVAVYKFRANFLSSVTWTHSLSREGLLLLRQDTDERSDAAAIAACAARGAQDATIERYSPLDLAALDKPQNHEFVPLHATAMSEGSAMMYYTNTAPASEAPVVTSSGFRPASGRR